MVLAIHSMPTARPLLTSLQRTSGTYMPRLLATQAILPFSALTFPPSHWPNSLRAHSYKAPMICIPTTHTVPATKYPGGAACVASAHGPQVIFASFGSTTSASVPALHALVVHPNLALALKWASCASLLVPAIPVSVHAHAHSILLSYSDATLISIMLKGNNGAMLKEGAKAVVGTFKDATGGKVSKEELACYGQVTVSFSRSSSGVFK